MLRRQQSIDRLRHLKGQRLTTVLFPTYPSHEPIAKRFPVNTWAKASIEINGSEQISWFLWDNTLLGFASGERLAVMTPTGKIETLVVLTEEEAVFEYDKVETHPPADVHGWTANNRSMIEIQIRNSFVLDMIEGHGEEFQCDNTSEIDGLVLAGENASLICIGADDECVINLIEEPIDSATIVGIWNNYRYKCTPA